MAHYGKIEYWEDRYKKDNSAYDWYQKYNGLKDIITQHVDFDMNILDLGAGNSDLVVSMYNAGYKKIEAVDLSTMVVQQMKDSWAADGYANLVYTQGDAMALHSTYQPKQFNCVIDKGTLDAILCGYDSAPNADLVMKGIYNVLSNQGVFICISYGTKEMRMEFFEHPEFDWKITVYQVAKKTINTCDLVVAENEDEQNFHWIYVCKKQVPDEVEVPEENEEEQ